MNIFKTNIKIRASSLIIIILSVLIIAFGQWFWNTNDPKASAVLGSLCAGFFVALIQFLISWQDYKQMEKLQDLKLIKILYDRDDRTYYEEYIKKAKKELLVMGVTTIRFFNDFADDKVGATLNAKVLLDALHRGVKVRILVPSLTYLNKSKQRDLESVKQVIQSLREKHPNYSLEVKYFKHVPSHSIFKVDNTCIVGPVFPNLESKYTPALHLENISPMAERYIKYFEEEWEIAEN